MKRLILAVLLVAMFVGDLAPAVGAERVTIEYWAWTEHVAAARALEPIFEDLYPHIDLQVVDYGPWDLHDKLLIALAAGVGAPDVALLVQRRFDDYIATGKLLDLTDRFGHLQDQYPESMWAIVEEDGRVWGMPYDQNPAVLFYRTDIFREHGIEVPIETWDEFIEVGKSLTDPRRGRYMTWQFVPGGSWGVAYYVMFLQSRGGNVFDEHGRVIRNNELAKETLRWYYDLGATHRIALQTENNSPDFFIALKTDNLLTYANPNWGMFRIKELAPELAGRWGVMPWPKWSPDAPPYTGAWGGNVVTIPAQTKHPEEAMAWVEFLTASVEGQSQVWQVGGLVPAYLPTLESDAMRQPDEYLGGAVVYESVKVRELPVFNYYHWAEAEVIIGNHIDAMFAGQFTPEEAWDAIERELIARFE